MTYRDAAEDLLKEWRCDFNRITSGLMGSMHLETPKERNASKILDDAVTQVIELQAKINYLERVVYQ